MHLDRNPLRLSAPLVFSFILIFLAFFALAGASGKGVEGSEGEKEDLVYQPGFEKGFVVGGDGKGIHDVKANLDADVIGIEAGRMASKASLNVFKSPLAYFGGSPIKTGFLRNGYCEVPGGDYGVHAVAAEVTDEFLTFSAAQGNDLRTIGLKGGCKWCLCVSRWREAFDARKSDQDPVVPKVFLSATNEKALNKVTMDELKMFAAKEE